MSQIPQRIAQWLPIAKATAPLYGQDPLLLLAIIERESAGGEALKPRGPGGRGDGGHGYGLAQIDDRFHPSFIAAHGPDNLPLWQEPPFSILHLAFHLHFLERYFDGLMDEPMLPAIASYNASKEKVRDRIRSLVPPVPRKQLIEALDAITTGGDYVSDVLAKRNRYVLTA